MLYDARSKQLRIISVLKLVHRYCGCHAPLCTNGTAKMTKLPHPLDYNTFWICCTIRVSIFRPTARQSRKEINRIKSHDLIGARCFSDVITDALRDTKKWKKYFSCCPRKEDRHERDPFFFFSVFFFFLLRSSSFYPCREIRAVVSPKKNPTNPG